MDILDLDILECNNEPIMEDAFLYEYFDHERYLNDIIMEAADGATKKNIFQRLWDLLKKLLRGFVHALRKLKNKILGKGTADVKEDNSDNNSSTNKNADGKNEKSSNEPNTKESNKKDSNQIEDKNPNVKRIGANDILEISVDSEEVNVRFLKDIKHLSDEEEKLYIDLVNVLVCASVTLDHTKDRGDIDNPNDQVEYLYKKAISSKKISNSHDAKRIEAIAFADRDSFIELLDIYGGWLKDIESWRDTTVIDDINKLNVVIDYMRSTYNGVLLILDLL